MRRGRWKVQPEPRQELQGSREGAHTLRSLSPQKGADHSVSQVGKDLGKFQNMVSYYSDQVARGCRVES